jgi:hypothetical protein
VDEDPAGGAPWEEMLEAHSATPEVTLPLTVRPRAEADLDQASGWYEAQLPGLG